MGFVCLEEWEGVIIFFWVMFKQMCEESHSKNTVNRYFLLPVESRACMYSTPSSTVAGNFELPGSGFTLLQRHFWVWGTIIDWGKGITMSLQ